MTAPPVAEGELRRSRVPTPLVYAAPGGVHLVGRDGEGKCWAVVLTAGQAVELLGALSEVVDDLA